MATPVARKYSNTAATRMAIPRMRGCNEQVQSRSRAAEHPVILEAVYQAVCGIHGSGQHRPWDPNVPCTHMTGRVCGFGTVKYWAASRNADGSSCVRLSQRVAMRMGCMASWIDESVF